LIGLTFELREQCQKNDGEERNAIGHELRPLQVSTGSYTRNIWEKSIGGKGRYRKQHWKNQRNSEFFKLGREKTMGG